MSENPPTHPAANDDAAPVRGRGQAHRARLALLIAAVALAVLGLLSLVAVLLSAWIGAEPWPGFVTAAYFFLPLGFLLMIISVVVNVVSRGRS